jgi:predicted Fe-Mo cluster-binding NifX family protein
MKIVAVTDDGKTISAHFGRANKVAVYTIEDGQITNRELRDKVGHDDHDHEHGHDHHHHDHGGGHGHGRFREMLPVLSDCQILLARGMGRNAHQNLANAGIQAITTDITNIEEAVQAVINKTIADNPQRRH